MEFGRTQWKWRWLETFDTKEKLHLFMNLQIRDAIPTLSARVFGAQRLLHFSIPNFKFVFRSKRRTGHVSCECHDGFHENLFYFHNSLCNIHAQGVANALPRAALTEGATIRYRGRAMGVGKTRAARHSRTSGCILQGCEKENAILKLTTNIRAADWTRVV